MWKLDFTLTKLYTSGCVMPHAVSHASCFMHTNWIDHFAFIESKVRRETSHDANKSRNFMHCNHAVKISEHFSHIIVIVLRNAFNRKFAKTRRILRMNRRTNKKLLYWYWTRYVRVCHSMLLSAYISRCTSFINDDNSLVWICNATIRTYVFAIIRISQTHSHTHCIV